MPYMKEMDSTALQPRQPLQAFYGRCCVARGWFLGNISIHSEETPKKVKIRTGTYVHGR